MCAPQGQDMMAALGSAPGADPEGNTACLRPDAPSTSRQQPETRRPDALLKKQALRQQEAVKQQEHRDSTVKAYQQV